MQKLGGFQSFKQPRTNYTLANFLGIGLSNDNMLIYNPYRFVNK